MASEQINRVSARVVWALALTMLVTILIGSTQPPQPDEGTLAHIFQLACVLLVPAGLLYFATADWARPAKSIRPMLMPLAAVIAAFGLLYYLEHVRWR